MTGLELRHNKVSLTIRSHNKVVTDGHINFEVKIGLQDGCKYILKQRFFFSILEQAVQSQYS